MTRNRLTAVLGGVVMWGLLLGMFGTAPNPAYATKKPTAPTITSFKPSSGATGNKVTITGTNLSGATKVSFKGAAATIIKDTATKITTKVPTGAKTGPIKVTTSGGTATSASSFKVT